MKINRDSDTKTYFAELKSYEYTYTCNYLIRPIHTCLSSFSWFWWRSYQFYNVLSIIKIIQQKTFGEISKQYLPWTFLKIRFKTRSLKSYRFNQFCLWVEQKCTLVRHSLRLLPNIFQQGRLMYFLRIKIHCFGQNNIYYGLYNA